MKKHLAFIVLIWLSISANCQNNVKPNSPNQVIFAFGGDINRFFVKYVGELTGKPRPKVCYVPTASADNIYNMNYFYMICRELPLVPYILQSWPSSAYDTQSFEEILTGMDAIVVGGGNTLNMMAIWKAQGIDTVLQKCLDKGIILAGGSAGSICWFDNGISDSRPKEFSIVNGLSFLKFSQCPHYSGTPIRKSMYQEKILNGSMLPGYGCDDLSGILFVNGKFQKAVSLNNESNSYYLSIKNGVIIEEKLPIEIIR